MTEILYDVPADRFPSLATQKIIISFTRNHLMSQQLSWAYACPSVGEELVTKCSKAFYFRISEFAVTSSRLGTKYFVSPYW